MSIRDHWPFILIGAAVLWVLMGGSFGNLAGAKPEARKAPEAQAREVSVVQTLRVGESETVKVLTVPDPMLNDPLFDTRCLIYVNDKIGRTTTTCLGRPQPAG